jgi:hypothetical protein
VGVLATPVFGAAVNQDREDDSVCGRLGKMKYMLSDDRFIESFVMTGFLSPCHHKGIIPGLPDPVQIPCVVAVLP